VEQNEEFFIVTGVVHKYIYRVSQEKCARFGRVFLMLKYNDITKNTHAQS